MEAYKSGNWYSVILNDLADEISRLRESTLLCKLHEIKGTAVIATNVDVALNRSRPSSPARIVLEEHADPKSKQIKGMEIVLNDNAYRDLLLNERISGDYIYEHIIIQVGGERPI